MHRGRVSADQQALVTIDVFDGEGRPQPLDVVLDTGFTGYLTLPADSIRLLGLPPEVSEPSSSPMENSPSFGSTSGQSPGTDAQAMC